MKNKAFTLIELLVVISIIALLSSVVLASLSTSRKKARDSQRIQNARQIAIALEQYEHTFNTYRVANSGLSDTGSGFVAKGGSGGYTTSILSALKSVGLYTNTNLKDPIYGLDNYYLGLCTSTNSYNIFVKLEQEQYNNSTTSISNTCGGAEASNLGFNFIASTAGGASGGGGIASGFGGAYETGMSAPLGSVTGPDGLTYGTVTAEDGRVWLDRNLGATKVASSFDDYLAYGDLYQWGRSADGHQKINRTGPSSGSPTYGATNTQSITDVPGNNLFIYPNSDWRLTKNDGLWDKTSGLNNPCPSGFHVPTRPEWQSWLNNISGTSTCPGLSSCHTLMASTALKLPTPAARWYVSPGSIVDYGYGYYWSSSIAGTQAYITRISTTASYTTYSNHRAFGMTVRCTKD